VVRHRLVGEIVDAYARFDADQQNRPLRSAPRTGPPQNRAARRAQR